jgi:hypothetical protein
MKKQMGLFDQPAAAKVDGLSPVRKKHFGFVRCFKN